MLINPRNSAITATILLFGLMAGFFYAFSVCVMTGLNNISPEGAITAMNAINAAVLNPVFFATFFLTPVFTLITALLCHINGATTARNYLGFATIIYCLGVIAPTAAINVPLNNALALVTDTDITANAKQTWQAYTAPWTDWNTARTVASAVSTILSVIAHAKSKA